LIYLQITSALNGSWPDWVLAKGMGLVNVSNMQSSGLGLSCIIPTLNDPIIENAATMSLVPAFTLLLVALLVGIALKTVLYKCIWPNPTPFITPEDQAVDEDFALVCIRYSHHPSPSSLSNFVPHTNQLTRELTVIEEELKLIGLQVGMLHTC